MANAEQLEILKSGVDKWNEWTKANSNLRIELSNANLIDADLSGAILKDANLAYANLAGADLADANMTNANLIDTNLIGVYLTEANMFGANLSGADLTNAHVINTNLIGANLSKADLSSADLSGANLSNANLAGVDLYNAIFTYANLSNTNFDNSELYSTVFGFTDLSSAMGLETVKVSGKCIIDFETLRASRTLPKSFLLKIGLPELLIDYLPDFYSDSINLFPAFLSHSKENREFAHKLYEALIAKGVSVFFDEKKLKPGDSLVKTITKGINHYDKTILICSKESLKSTWVDYELELVLKKEQALMEQKISEDVGLLIPITIDDHIFTWKGPKEWDIKTRYIGDFREWHDGAKFERALNELIQALNIKRLDIKPPSFL